MNSKLIKYVGIDDLRDFLFEGQWTLTEGVAYNSYVVVDDKIALIDTAASAFGDKFIDEVIKATGGRSVDYLIINHMEPDHSGLISRAKAMWPDMTIVTNAKAVPMVAGYHGITDNIFTVKENDVLNLGHCSLVFKMTPMVHWPETMMTYLPEEETLFSGDAFGCFGALKGRGVDHFEEFRDEMVRYYASIVGKYGQTVQAAMKKLAGVPVSRICSTHGPVWENDIPKVLDIYDRMSRYQTEKGVCIVYGSMYGNTAEAAKAIYNECTARGIKCAIHDAVTENPSFIYKDIFEYDTLVCGAPTYNNDVFPAVSHILQGVAARLVKNHRFAAFGSYTWVGGSVKLMNQAAESAGLQVLCEGMPFKQGFDQAKPDVKSFVDCLEA
ncbi:MAG: FprA family A-type flavoprotein [Candidatus Cryptobacteroides sp.]